MGSLNETAMANTIITITKGKLIIFSTIKYEKTQTLRQQFLLKQ